MKPYDIVVHLWHIQLSEAGQKKGILMVDIGEKEAEVEVTNLPLTPMRSKNNRGKI